MHAFAPSVSLPLHPPPAPGSTLRARRPRAARAAPLRRARGPVCQAGGGAGGGAPAPDGSTITAALEVTFRAVWVRLMTAGVGAAYSAAIREFVVACVAAYKAGYSMTALKLELAANEASGTIMGREVRLNDSEKDTRLIWIGLVYMTLARFRFASENTPPPPARELAGSRVGDLIRGLSALVDSVAEAARKGYSHTTYKMELNLSENVAGPDGAKEKRQFSAAEKSLRSQWTRIVFTTIGLLPEELKGFK